MRVTTWDAPAGMATCCAGMVSAVAPLAPSTADRPTEAVTAAVEGLVTVTSAVSVRLATEGLMKTSLAKTPPPTTSDGRSRIPVSGWELSGKSMVMPNQFCPNQPTGMMARADHGLCALSGLKPYHGSLITSHSSLIPGLTAGVRSQSQSVSIALVVPHRVPFTNAEASMFTPAVWKTTLWPPIPCGAAKRVR